VKEKARVSSCDVCPFNDFGFFDELFEFRDGESVHLALLLF